MEREFEECSSRVSAGEVKHVSRDDLLRLYGLYSVVTKGSASAKGPSLLDVRGRAKWQAWKDVSNMKREDAMRDYVKLVERLESRPEDERKAEVDGMGMDASIKGFTVSEGAKASSSTQPRLDLTHWASVNDVRSVVFCIEKQGVSPDYHDEEGLTALMRAADRDARNAVRALLRAGANVHVEDGEGQTALHYAALCDNPIVAGLLVAAGANPDKRDNDDLSPYDHASAETRDVMHMASRGVWEDPESLDVRKSSSEGAMNLPLMAGAGAVLVCVCAVAYVYINARGSTTS